MIIVGESNSITMLNSVLNVTKSNWRFLEIKVDESQPRGHIPGHIKFIIDSHLLVLPSPHTSNCIHPLIQMYPRNHYFDTYLISSLGQGGRGGRVHQVGNP